MSEKIEKVEETIMKKEVDSGEKTVEIEPLNEEEVKEEVNEKLERVAEWKPKTEIGKRVKSGEIRDIDEILDNGYKILEPEIVDALLDLEVELINIGQAKGKFGGGKRRVFRSTQKKTMEGNKIHFETMAVVGNRDGYIGIGYGKSRDTLPARDKAIRKAKTNIFKIRRGCGSWECSCKEYHSIPFKVTGKVGSVEITLMPAPKGKGIVADKEVAKVLSLAGIKDVWTKTRGQAKIKLNLILALEKALRKLSATKLKPEYYDLLNIAEGSKKLYEE